MKKTPERFVGALKKAPFLNSVPEIFYVSLVNADDGYTRFIALLQTYVAMQPTDNLNLLETCHTCYFMQDI